ncbi:MAG: cytidine deaminase [Bacteroidales bacterium]|jgi:cytidine deaminase|nr:cytidine deaminase [Bacteroidales bacterium]
MDKRKIEIEYTVFENKEELVEEDRMLIEKAKEISVNAYIPYSAFRVGVAVLLDNDKILTANNQENASYPEGLCAERVALFYAMSQYPNQKIKSIAVYGNPQKFTLTHFISPCGGCRQVMYEYEYRHQSKMRILLSGNSGKILLVEGVENLLPLQFSAKDLSINE